MKNLKKLKKVRSHTIYKLDGVRVVGCTTIVNQLAKPQLIKWANDLGLEGIDSGSYTDAAATIGTIAHHLVACHFNGEPPCLTEYSPAEISIAENAMLSFLQWVKGKNIKVLMVEQDLVSQKGFGGTFDLYCEIDGVKYLIDFKSSNAIYGEYRIQLAGYKLLLEEHGHQVDKCMLVRIGRDETEGFETREYSDLSGETRIFLNLLEVYKIRKQLKI